MRWSDEEVNRLCESYTGTSEEDLVAMLPGRNWPQIVAKAKYIGLSRVVKYSLEELEKRTESRSARRKNSKHQYYEKNADSLREWAR